MLQKIDFEAKDKRGKENLFLNHLSILEEDVMINIYDGVEINYAFPNEHVLASSFDLIPLFAKFSNNFASMFVHVDWSFNQMRKSVSNVK